MDRLLNPQEPLQPTVDECNLILKELETFRSTRLFQYIVDNQRYDFHQTLQVLLDHEPQNQTDYNNREALLGEARLRDKVIYEISGRVQDEITAILKPTENEENEVELPE